MADTPNTSKKSSEVGPGPLNLNDAEKYTQTLNGLFDRFMEMAKEDWRDVMETTIRPVNNHMSKTWADMATADVSIMMLMITDPSCAALHESMDTQPVTSSDPEEDVLTGDQVISTLPQGQNRVVSKHCITLLDSLSVATHHISVAMVNLSVLAKLVDVDTFKKILRASVPPISTN